MDSQALTAMVHGTMAITRDDLVRHLDRLLDPKGIRDYGPNGLQVEGRAEIRTLATATSASLAACREAANQGADALLVHHGLFWGREVRITGPLRKRLAKLLAAEVSLIAYHLPLDAHATLGNNAVLLQALGATIEAPFAEHHGLDIGWIGELGAPMPVDAFITHLAAVFSHPVVHCPGDGRTIRRIGAVSGGGQSHLMDAAQAGCDALVTGEVSEQNWHEAVESGCHLFACGHHATERMAIHRLGALLARDNALRHLVIDLPNPI